MTKGYGVTIDEIAWGCPADFEAYEKAYDLEQEAYDSHMYDLGIYNMRAFSVVLGNAFSSKGSKSLEYFKKPIYEQIKEDNKEMSEEEKNKYVQQLFAGLSVMKSNFESSHRKDNENNGRSEN